MAIPLACTVCGRGVPPLPGVICTRAALFSGFCTGVPKGMTCWGTWVSRGRPAGTIFNCPSSTRTEVATDRLSDDTGEPKALTGRMEGSFGSEKMGFSLQAVARKTKQHIDAHIRIEDEVSDAECYGLDEPPCARGSRPCRKKWNVIPKRNLCNWWPRLRRRCECTSSIVPQLVSYSVTLSRTHCEGKIQLFCLTRV